jgi:hypothetical protein
VRAQPTITNHLRQALRNQRLAQACEHAGESWEWRQWAVTAAFYSALHLAKALALRTNEHKVRGETWHELHSRVIRTHASVRATVSYERLRLASWQTRYELWIPSHRSANKLVYQDLAAVDQDVRRLC